MGAGVRVLGWVPPNLGDDILLVPCCANLPTQTHTPTAHQPSMAKAGEVVEEEGDKEGAEGLDVYVTLPSAHLPPVLIY